MTVPSLLQEPGRVDEPGIAQEYSEVLTRVAAEHSHEGEVEGWHLHGHASALPWV